MELNETVWLVLQVIGVMLLLVVTVFAGATLLTYHGTLKRRWLALDTQLVGFGQTAYGRAAYTSIQQARGQVDSASDPLIQRVMAVSVLRELAARKIITGQQVSQGLVFLLDLGGELLDGEVDTDLPSVPGAAVQ